MNKCEVYFKDIEDKYEGEYEFAEGKITVNIFDYQKGEESEGGDEIKYIELNVYDIKNHIQMYSPAFRYNGFVYSYVQYETYVSDFYFVRNTIEDAKDLSVTDKLESIKLYNPLLIHGMGNPVVKGTITEKEATYTIERNPEKRIITINENNIDRIEFCASATWNHRSDLQKVDIESENYAKIVFTNPIAGEDVLRYINEFDVLINAFWCSRYRSYQTKVSIGEKEYLLFHKLIGKEKYTNRLPEKPVRINFYEYVQMIYKRADYRNTNEKNKLILLDFKIPETVEEQYMFYFRFIDNYMGDIDSKSSNYGRLSSFVDMYLDYFAININIDNYKNELNSLRNHFVHEGYYFPDNRFAVKNRKKEIIYYKDMDYIWLLDVVKKLRLCAYIALYKEVLNIDIDESKLRHALVNR